MVSYFDVIAMIPSYVEENSARELIFRSEQKN